MKNQLSNDELTVKDIILLIKDHWKAWLKKWWVIAICVVLFLSYFGYKYSTTPTKYNASLNFVIENQTGGNAFGGLSSLIGSFGIRNAGKLSPFQIVEVGYSTHILEKVLFRKSTCGEDYLANYIIEAYEMDKIWTKNWGPEFEGFRFKDSIVSDFSRDEAKAFLSVASKVKGTNESRESGIFKVNFQEYTGIFNLKTTAVQECISYDLTSGIFNQTKYIFEDQLLEKRKESRDVLMMKRDSIKSLIDEKSLELANFEDRNRNTVLRNALVRKNQLMVEIQGLTTGYAELSKNFEVSDVQYLDTKDMFLVLERPYLPLSTINPSLKNTVVLSVILGSLLGILIVSLRKIYLEILE